MVIYDARPSSFTQLATTAEWEYIHSIMANLDGIDFSVGNAMNPSLDTPGRNAVMADGNAVVRGYLWRCDAPVSTAIPAASAQNRIDRLVLRLTRGATTSATVVQPTVVTGTPSGTPTIPPLTQTPTGIWDIPISSWTATSAGALTGLSDDRDGNWKTITTGAFTGSLRCRKVSISPGTNNAVMLNGTLNAASTGGGAFNIGSLPNSTYYPASITRLPIALTAGFVSTSGAVDGSLRLYIPAGSGALQVIIPTLAATLATSVDINGIYPLG